MAATWTRLGRAGLVAAQRHFQPGRLITLSPRACTTPAGRSLTRASSTVSPSPSPQAGSSDPDNKPEIGLSNRRKDEGGLIRTKAAKVVKAASMANRTGRLLRVEPDGSALRLLFEHCDRSIPRIWFRDSCACGDCVSEFSGQKKFATCDIDAEPELESSRVREDGSLELVWAHDFLHGNSHTSHYSLPLLQSQAGLAESLRMTRDTSLYRILWDRAIFEQDLDARAISYDDWMAGGQHFATGLLNLLRWGLIVLEGVPDSQDAVKDIAHQIGPLQNTFYGHTWDVVSKPNAENVAYTDEALGLHQDLLYLADPPFIQLLHCLKNDCDGGDSLFSDGLRAAAQLQLQSPADHAALAQTPVAYRYARNGHFYAARHAVVVVDDDDDDGPTRRRRRPARRVRWAPPFQAPFGPAQGAAVLPRWRAAARRFRAALAAPAAVLPRRLRPGDCVLFDNSRVLHGRTAFDGVAAARPRPRLLRGAYLDMHTTRSALARLVAAGTVDVSRDAPWWVVERDQAAKMFGAGCRGGVRASGHAAGDETPEGSAPGRGAAASVGLHAAQAQETPSPLPGRTTRRRGP